MAATLGTRGFFFHAKGNFISSASGRHVFGRRPKTWAAKPQGFSHWSLFKTWLKLETAHEKPLAPSMQGGWLLNRGLNVVMDLHNAMVIYSFLFRVTWFECPYCGNIKWYWYNNIFILLLALLIHHVTFKGIFQPLRVMQFWAVVDKVLSTKLSIV